MNCSTCGTEIDTAKCYECGHEQPLPDTPSASTYPDDKVLALVLSIRHYAHTGVGWNIIMDAIAALESSRGKQAATVDRDLFDRAMIIINESYLYGHEDGKNNTERGANWVLGRLNALRALAGKGRNEEANNERN